MMEGAAVARVRAGRGALRSGAGHRGRLRARPGRGSPDPRPWEEGVGRRASWRGASRRSGEVACSPPTRGDVLAEGGGLGKTALCVRHAPIDRRTEHGETSNLEVARGPALLR